MMPTQRPCPRCLPQLCLSLLLSLLPTALQAQQMQPWQEDFWQWVEEETDGEGNTEQWEEAFEVLTELENHPINLNSATREQLEQIPLLSPQQVSDILEYVYRNRAMQSLNELALVESIDFELRHLLRHFVCVHPVVADSPPLQLDTILRHGDSQLTVSGTVPFYTRQGIRSGGYLGDRYTHTVRYQYAYRDRVKVGFTGAQDAGEPFFANRNTMGYDHYAYYLQLNQLGAVERLCLGMYQVQMGQGLIMNGAFSLGKTLSLQGGSRAAATIRSVASRSPASYLQGAAVSVRLSSHWRATAFASCRPLDATLNSDGTVRTILTSSYHRTTLELEKKNNTVRWDAGGSIGWHDDVFHLNVNGVYSYFDRPLNPSRQSLYQRYQATGNGLANASVDYGYVGNNLSLAGETAINADGYLALLHRAAWHPSTAVTLSAIHRFYDHRYTALHARSFAEGGKVQNEHGIYVGMEWRPVWQFLLTAYADYAHFHWARYRASRSSDAFDAKVACKWNTDGWTLDGYYRMHIKQRDNADKTILANHVTQRLRLRFNRQCTPSLSWQTQADGVSVRFQRQYWGYMASQQLTWKTAPFRLSGRIAYFHTDNYESRLYQYEPSLRYEFYLPAFYGEGIRYSILTTATLAARLALTAKLGITNYFDRPTISSGLQEIHHSSQTDLQVQLIWKF